MTIEEVKKELEKFNDFKFFEDGHYYEYKGQRVGVSVTRLIEEYANEFDRDGIAEKVAIRDNKTVDEVLEEWEYKNKFACAKGSNCHEFAQSLWSGNDNYYDDFDDSIEFKNANNSISIQAINFYEDYNNIYEHIQDEQVVGSAEYDIASAVDHLFYNKLTGEVDLIDYKTNSILKGYNDEIKNRRYTKKMKIPLHKIDDDAIHHYYIQLSIYKYLIEKYTNIKIANLVIVYMSENIEKYEIINVPYLKEEVEEILENRRVKNMNGMGVLLMGASGSGKSTSLRNLPAEETAIINITNKPMPFRNKDGKTIVTLKDFAKEGEKDLTYEELYKRIIATIKATKKKIIVIDDSSYMMAFENFEKATNKGYDKFTTMAKNYYDLIKSAISCGDEKIVYVITHEEVDDVNQLYRPKTIGKMLSNQLVIEGLFSIVLRSMYKNGEYIFQTQNDGTSVCKSPMDMFEQKEIPNDLYEIDKIVREYYGFKPIENKESEEK